MGIYAIEKAAAELPARCGGAPGKWVREKNQGGEAGQEYQK